MTPERVPSDQSSSQSYGSSTMREMTPEDATCLSEGAFRELCGTGAVRLEGRAVVLLSLIHI